VPGNRACATSIAAAMSSVSVIMWRRRLVAIP
jgi:hypothetical protein